MRNVLAMNVAMLSACSLLLILLAMHDVSGRAAAATTSSSSSSSSLEPKQSHSSSSSRHLYLIFDNKICFVVYAYAVGKVYRVAGIFAVAVYAVLCCYADAVLSMVAVCDASYTNIHIRIDAVTYLTAILNVEILM